MIIISKKDLCLGKSIAGVIAKPARFGGTKIVTKKIKTTVDLSDLLFRNAVNQEGNDPFFIFEAEESIRLAAMSCQEKNRIMLQRKIDRAGIETKMFKGDTRESFIYYLNALLLKYLLWPDNFQVPTEFSALTLVNDDIEFSQLTGGDESAGYVAIGFNSAEKKGMPSDVLSFVGVELISRI
jgi:hypothetical protein